MIFSDDFKIFISFLLFISVMGKLPATSYVRLVDIWLIFGQMIPFLEDRLSIMLKKISNYFSFR